MMRICQQPATRGSPPCGLPLLACTILWTAIAVIWMIVLPAIAEHPQVETRLRQLDARGIDPSAMFYSELPAMEEVHSRMQRLHRRDRDALWRPSP